jgi:hypothetical protein
MNGKWIRSFMFFFLLTFSFVFFASTPQPEYWPTCDSPQNIGPMKAMGGSQVSLRSSIVWNGKDFAAIWTDMADGRIWFRKFYADGTPLSAAVNPGGYYGDYWYPSKIVWNGSGYGIAWSQYYDGQVQTFFLRLDASGNAIGAWTQVSNYGGTATAQSYYCDLAWNGSQYCVVWADYRSGNGDIYATLLDSSGAVFCHDTPICTTAAAQRNPRVAWSQGSGRYQIVWEDDRTPPYSLIYGVQLTPGNMVYIDNMISSGTANNSSPALAATPNGLGVVWIDYHAGNRDVYFVRLNASGYKIGAEARLTSDASDSFSPAVAWTGAEYGVFFEDNRSGNAETWFQRVAPSGDLSGSNYRVTYSGEAAQADAAFAKYGYLVTGTIYGGANYVSPWGCLYSYTPPSCPGNLLAYNITGSAATIAWSLSGSNTADIAYYIVYRNNAEIGRTSNTYYADTGLGLSTTYNYMIQPVDASQMQNYTCTSSIYIKTNATLTLKLDKSDPNAHLYWNDAGMNNYNVFRGTSPQVMGLIGSTAGQTADDANVLLDNVNYFYTVDDPGQ